MVMAECLRYEQAAMSIKTSVCAYAIAAYGAGQIIDFYDVDELETLQ